MFILLRPFYVIDNSVKVVKSLISYLQSVQWTGWKGIEFQPPGGLGVAALHINTDLSNGHKIALLQQ
jgi:hypothetical protein